MDKIKGLLPTIDIKFGTNSVYFNSEGIPTVIPCINSGLCQIIAGSSNSGSNVNTDAKGYILMHEGALVITFVKNSIDSNEYNSHFGSGTIQVGEDIILDSAICSLLEIPNGSKIFAGNYFIEYEDENYIAVKF